MRTPTSLLSRVGRLAVIGMLAALTAAAPAAQAAPTVEEPADTARIEALERRIEALEAELKAARAGSEAGGSASGDDARRSEELERKLDALTREIERLKVGEPAAGPGAESGDKADRASRGLGPGASKVYAAKPGVSIGGYGEMLLQAPEDSRDDGELSGRRRNLDLLRAVLYVGYKFDDRILFNSELEVEHATTGEGDEEKGEVSAEFAYLDFVLRQDLNLRAGLLLMPVGFINELHEPTSYLGARRPAVETRILPTTWREAGVGLTGETDRLSWRTYVVTGLKAEGFEASGIREGRQGGSEAIAEDFAWTGRLDFRPTLATLFGGSVFVGEAGQGLTKHQDFTGVDPSFAVIEDIGALTTILDLHGEYRDRGLEVRALWALAAIDDVAELNAALGLEGADSIGERMTGGYVQVGYDLFARSGTGAVASGRSLVPYFRWEKLDTQSEVPAGYERDPANDQRLLTFGAAFKPHPQVVVKVDWQDAQDEADTAVDQLNVALGYTF